MSGPDSTPPSAVPGRLVPVPVGASLEQRVQALEAEARKFALLLETSRFYSGEHELDALIARVVQQTTRIMDCDRSSVFLLDREKNELYALFAEGLEVKELRFSAARGIAGFVATNNVTLNIPDAYQDSRFNPDIDKATGYRTVSILCVPMRDRRGKVMGVLQCLNKRGDDGKVSVFAAEDELLLLTVGSQAQFYLENTALYRQMDKLFEAFVEATTRSIDDRDPCTSGHSRRVMMYSLNLARAVHECTQPPFDKIQYTRDRIRQLRYACLLHDVGKIGVREYILTKAQKLHPAMMYAIHQRFMMLRERSRADCLMEAISKSQDPQEILAGKHTAFCNELDAALARIESANSANFMSDADVKVIEGLLEKGWITKLECQNLVVRRGNLTDDEWVDMRSHVTKSFRMLQQIPWPSELSDLCEVAYTHHEKRDGSGYPRRLKGDEIHFDGQIMCVADIFDALTASDRPYKKAIPFERAKMILMEEEAAKGKMLPELVQLFFEKKCYEIGDRPVRETNLGVKPPSK
ncbi:MAG TPA: HD domain-containing phosphohydrolase [Planctomycetota bacterium]|nr:HD domain-containing phosphohydrolase [Planctomycetota bacterium]